MPLVLFADAFAPDGGGEMRSWFVTNRQLINWVRNPVAAGSSSDVAPCPVKPPGTTEVCDGWDNDNDALVDEGVTRSCSYNEGNFLTCASSCPASYPRP
jgi:hypothetical protein